MALFVRHRAVWPGLCKSQSMEPVSLQLAVSYVAPCAWSPELSPHYAQLCTASSSARVDFPGFTTKHRTGYVMRGHLFHDQRPHSPEDGLALCVMHLASSQKDELCV